MERLSTPTGSPTPSDSLAPWTPGVPAERRGPICREAAYLTARGIGVTLTGILLAGVSYFWREILGVFGGLYRKYTDESKLMEHSETLRRVA
jgi:hypothetical protein